MAKEKKPPSNQTNGNGANLGFESKLRLAADKLVDEAMVAIERVNPRLKGVLPKDYARPALDKQRLGELIDLIGLGTAEHDIRSPVIRGNARQVPRPVAQAGLFKRVDRADLCPALIFGSKI